MTNSEATFVGSINGQLKYNPSNGWSGSPELAKCGIKVCPCGKLNIFETMVCKACGSDLFVCRDKKIIKDESVEVKQYKPLVYYFVNNRRRKISRLEFKRGENKFRRIYQVNRSGGKYFIRRESETQITYYSKTAFKILNP